MPLTKQMRLKIFGLVSVREEIKGAIMPNDLWLTIVAGYELSGAILAANAMLESRGLKPEEYDAAFIHLAHDVESLLGWNPAVKLKVEEISVPEKVIPIRRAEKSAMELMAYLKFIADMAATESEKKVLEKVGEKFLLKYAEVKAVGDASTLR